MKTKKPSSSRIAETSEVPGAQSGLKFEEALKRLEEIVEKLEGGTVTLDEVMKLYEEGILLSKNCMERLEEAELKVKRLMKTAGGKFELADGIDE